MLVLNKLERLLTVCKVKNIDDIDLSKEFYFIGKTDEEISLVWDKETIIYAELDMNLPAACKMEHDAIGHYARPDVLELKVNEK